MTELTRDDVVEVLGQVGDAVVADIIATGVTKDQLVVVRDRVVRQRKSHNPGPPLDPGPMAHAVEILERRTKGLLGEGGSTLE
jgi:hypothetical protein